MNLKITGDTFGQDIGKVRLPKGIVHLKLEKEGYEKHFFQFRIQQ